MSRLRAVSRSARVLRYPVAALSAAFLVAAPTAHAAVNPVPPSLSSDFLVANAGQHMVLCADPDSGIATVKPLTLTIDPLCVWEQSGPDSDLVMYNPKSGTVLGIKDSGSPYNFETVAVMPYDPQNSYEQWAWGHPDGSGLIGLPLLFHDDQSFNANAFDSVGKFVTITDAGQPTRADQSWSTVSIAD
ncbi:hypothetical protein [Streptomyces sp. NPDC048277]|uniref:hypothetical protein n=1 Tax=Streptomyces sp. NPDC048277 TaxID=3155027 RepID=UPI003400FFE0